MGRARRRNTTVHIHNHILCCSGTSSRDLVFPIVIRSCMWLSKTPSRKLGQVGAALYLSELQLLSNTATTHYKSRLCGPLVTSSNLCVTHFRRREIPDRDIYKKSWKMYVAKANNTKLENQCRTATLPDHCSSKVNRMLTLSIGERELR